MNSNNLKTARVNKDLTQADAAHKLGISPSTLAKWEKGEMEPNSAQIISMCKLYEVSADVLIGLKPIVQTTKY